ncbi:G-protein coupled receptor G6 [Takifugu flavidus]|uniref:G-protein coupled receptor G6 n=1 Tax=Takifugu flavidus TaxID=433684 RepID=A0A5C6NNI4_9TELE|nr:G-protein coupled receptor G6 [Takifugu flavidus]
MDSNTDGSGGGWRHLHIVSVVLLWTSVQRNAPFSWAGSPQLLCTVPSHPGPPFNKLLVLPSHSALACSFSSCDLVLTEAQGSFTSPCYPQLYPNSQSCTWILQAPAGFIIQLTFLDFYLEEAQGCIYDRVVVNTGSADVKFCGPTAKGLTLNSTGNVMELLFTSDFSVQKKGFSVSFKHVAVALRNQKVLISGGSSHITEVSDSVSLPTLSQFTLCFEVERITQKQVRALRNHPHLLVLVLLLTTVPWVRHQKEWIFTYYDSGNNEALSFGADKSGMQMIIDGVSCSIDSIISTADITSSMKLLCFLWTSADGQVAVYSDGSYEAKTCSTSTGHTVPPGGRFRLGGQHSFDGNIYNLRLWDYAMTVQQLSALSCDSVGNVIDWDNGHWDIPSSLAQTDATLSCICSPHCIRFTTAAPSSGECC